MAKKRSAKKVNRWGNLIPSEEAREKFLRAAFGVMAVVLIGGVVFGSLVVQDEIESDERYYLDTWVLDFGPFPAWVTPEIERQISTIALPDSEHLSLFQRGCLTRFREILEDSPWISQVGEINLSYPTSSRPGMIRTGIRLREPVAIVKVGTRFYLTDSQGMRLGEAYTKPHGSWFHVPVITGVRTPTEIPLPGHYWRAQDINEGREVARVLFASGIHEEFAHRPIDEIDVSNVGGRLRPQEGDIVLHCDGRQLVWGRSPKSRESRTIQTKELVQNLRDVLGSMHESNWKLVKLHYKQPVADKG